MAGLIGGGLILVAFGIIEARVAEPMFPLGLFKNVAFTSGNAANLLASVARGGLQFMPIIWLQGIWLPLHGYNYAQTPLWAGIYLLPMTIGFLIAGPVSGFLSDRFGPRLFAAVGLLVMAASFVGLLLIPGDFDYLLFGALIFINGLGGGPFAAPNTSLVMSSVPANLRGAASAGPFHDGLVIVFWLAIGMSVVGALASLLPGKRVATQPANGGVGDLVAHEAELESELVESQPFAPAARIPEPLDPAADKVKSV